MKVLVLGGAGMAGHVVATYLKGLGYAVDTLSGSRKLDEDTTILDATNTSALSSFLEDKQYDVVVNCIGVLVKQSEDRKDLASYLNGYLPHFLEHFYSTSDTKLIHLSTDCVFSGKNAPYKENSVYDGEIFYDRSKALGEVINNKDLTLRMSIIGPEIQSNGVGLFNWFMHQSGEISGYTGALWNGITTIELAKAIDQAIQQGLTGLYHLVPNRNISKYDLLGIFKDIFGRTDITISPNDSVKIDKTLINTRDDFAFEVSDYPSMIQEMKSWIDQHKDIYPHYA